jgi:hypothetical protein
MLGHLVTIRLVFLSTAQSRCLGRLSWHPVQQSNELQTFLFSMRMLEFDQR